MKEVESWTSEDRMLTGLKELAEFLEITRPTAMKLKNSGKFPFVQIGNKLIFNTKEVLAGIKGKPKK